MREVLIVILKEIKSITRDKKTILIALLLPLLVLPISLYIMDSGVKSAERSAEDDMVIACDQNSKHTMESLLGEKYDIVVKSNCDTELKKGNILAFVTAKSQKNMQSFVIRTNPTSLKAQYASSVIEKAITHHREDLLERIAMEKEMIEIPKVEIKIESIKSGSDSLYYIEMLLPMMLLIYGCLGITTISNDTGAGEKERKTLESLMSTSAKRRNIFMGKTFVAAAMGMISIVVLVIGLEIYLIVMGEPMWGTINQIILLFFIMLLICIFIALVTMTLSFMARSYKEAQTFNAPLSVLFLLPSYFVMSMDISEISPVFYWAPIFNIVCILKEIVGNAVSYEHYMLTCVSIILCNIIFLIIGIKKINEERILERINE